MNFDIDRLVSEIDFTKNSLVECKNGLLLTNFEIEILEKYKIQYKKYNNLKGILFEIEEILNYDSSLDDLEQVSKSIAERDYYQNSNK